MSAPSPANFVALLTADSVPLRAREETTTAWEVIALPALGIADWGHELAPVSDSSVVFRDSAFADDMARTDLAAILEQHGLAGVWSL